MEFSIHELSIKCRLLVKSNMLYVKSNYWKLSNELAPQSSVILYNTIAEDRSCRVNKINGKVENIVAFFLQRYSIS